MSQTGAPDAPLPVGEDEFRLIADSAPVAVWVTRLDRQRSFVNRAYVAFLGVPYAEALAFDWRTILHPEDAARVLVESIAGEASLASFTLEGRYRRKDGAWRWLNSTSQPRWNAAGEHIGFIGVAHDVTDAKSAELALREREESLRLATESAGTASWALDLETMTGSWSPNRFELLGMERRSDGTGSFAEWIERIHPDDRAMAEAAARRCFTAGTPYTIEYRILRANDGAERWLQSHGSRVDYGDDRASRFVGISFDITGRKRAEERLRRNEESVRLAIEGAGMATWELDLDTMEGEWSANRFDLLGMPRRATLRGTVNDWLERVHPEDRELAREAAFRCFDEGVPYRIEYRIARADTGEERWLQSHGSRIDASRRFVGVSFDITERRRAEAALRASEGRFRAIFDQANDYLVTLGLDLRILSVNPAVLAALGYREDEVLGHSIRDFLEPDQVEIGVKALERKLTEGGATRLMLRVRSRDRRELVWEINSQLTTDAAGTPTGVHAIARDMTEAQRAETHLRLLIDELNHRVKNTLAIVQGIAQQSFKDDVAPATARAAFEGRLTALSEAHNVLTREHWCPVTMAQIIGDAVAPHGGVAGRFTLDGADLAILPKTAISLALAIHELATNAVKHGALSQADGRVAIRWSREQGEDGARLVLTWEESGGPPVGMPTRRGFGTRMIERGLAAELGGSVVIDFRPGGVVCTVDAPLPEGAE